ncbi:hypothetical protein M8494_29285 [Serratia ureilytica]
MVEFIANIPVRKKADFTMITANRRELPPFLRIAQGKAQSALKRDASQLFSPQGDKSTLLVLALESGGRSGITRFTRVMSRSLVR